MTSDLDCPDRFHTSARFARYMVEEKSYPGGGWTSQGRRCCTCGCRTLSILDENDKDITDQYVTRTWKVTYRELFREARHMRKWERDRKQARKHPCRGCSQPSTSMAVDGTYRCDKCLWAATFGDTP